MKKFPILITFALLLFVGIAGAQSDKKAEELVQKVVDKMASYKNFKAQLAYTMVNREMDIDEKKTGIIYVQGDSYRIEMEGQIIISDNTTIWTYLLDSEEVMVSSVEEDEENTITPNRVLTTYDESYKARFDNNSKYKNADLKMILLKPDENGKQFEEMSILVNEKNLSLENFSVYDKNGNVFTYNIIDLQTNLDLQDDLFTFNVDNYPDVEVIDMR